MSGGGKDYGVSVNFPNDGSHDSTSVTIALGTIGQPFTITNGTLSLNQGSLSAPSFTADFAIPPEINQQINKTAYFQQLFDQENKLDAAQAAADMQAAGIDPNMTLNQTLYGQGTGQATTAIHPSAAAGASSFTEKTLRAICWGVGGILGQQAGGPAGAFFGGAFASYCSDYVTDYYEQANNPPPPPSQMSSMPDDASVPIDNGDAWDGGTPSDGGESGGSDPNGNCLPPMAPGHSVIIPFEETMGYCL